MSCLLGQHSFGFLHWDFFSSIGFLLEKKLNRKRKFKIKQNKENFIKQKKLISLMKFVFFHQTSNLHLSKQKYKS
jgi:hypothetical protein